MAGLLAAGLFNAIRFGDQRARISAWALLALLPVLSVGGLAAVMDAKGISGWQQIRQRLATEREAREAAEHKQRLNDAARRTLRKSRPGGEVDPGCGSAARKRHWRALPRLKTRPPERIAEAGAAGEELKSTADEILLHTAGAPTGIEEVDRDIARAPAFAARGAKSFELLLEMLAATNPPSEEARAPGGPRATTPTAGGPK